jgi:hypothetical protein
MFQSLQFYLNTRECLKRERERVMRELGFTLISLNHKIFDLKLLGMSLSTQIFYPAILHCFKLWLLTQPEEQESLCVHTHIAWVNGWRREVVLTQQWWWVMFPQFSWHWDNFRSAECKHECCENVVQLSACDYCERHTVLTEDNILTRTYHSAHSSSQCVVFNAYNTLDFERKTCRAWHEPFRQGGWLKMMCLMQETTSQNKTQFHTIITENQTNYATPLPIGYLVNSRLSQNTLPL